MNPFAFLTGLFGGGNAAPYKTSAAVPVWTMVDETRMVEWIEPPKGSFQEKMQIATGPQLNTPPADFQGEHDVPKEGYPANPTRAKVGTWTATDDTWKRLTPYQKVAAMALMEADAADPDDARNAAAAMLNRASKGKEDLSTHVSSRLYQPTFEPAQHRRLQGIINSPHFAKITTWAERYATGQEKDPTNGATHFLAHPNVMLALEAREPQKYRSWRKWTGFDATSRSYRNQTITDRSHAFLAPEGRFSLSR